MPSVVQANNSTYTLQQIVNEARAYKDLTPVLGPSGWTQEPALSIANAVMQQILSQDMPWKFNRSVAAPFVTVPFQQDYATSITDLSWVESALRLDINNTTTPKPIFQVEGVRDLPRLSIQGIPGAICAIPNSAAVFGAWSANTVYPNEIGSAGSQPSPIQQFVDINGNYLVVSTYGTSGAVKPAAPTASSAGTTVADGSVVWTVVDPNGISFRIAGIPPQSGVTYQIFATYQKKPPRLRNLSDTLNPLPDDYIDFFRQGFIAYCYRHSNPVRFQEQFALWQATLRSALGAADRERDETSMVPNTSLMGGGSTSQFGIPIGPAWPYFPIGY